MALEEDTFDDLIPVSALSKEVSVTVRNSAGVPVPAVRVDWRARDRGFIWPSYSITDELGRAAAVWTFGPDTQNARVTATAQGFGAVTISRQSMPLKPLVLNEFRRLRLATYDGSGQTVHPDFVSVSTATLTGNFLALTPYPNGQTALENPVVYTSATLTRWRIPAGSRNPLASPTELHLSDPDIVYDPERGELMLYYRQVGTEENSILLIRSRDGVTWTDPVLVAHAPNHQMVSPSVVRMDASHWFMWTVNANSGCLGLSAQVELRRSENGVDWSDAEPVSLTQPGFFPWHIEVQWVPSRQEYWAVYNVKVAQSCTTTALYLATSPDGLTWQTYPSPVISRGATPPLTDIVYRSTFNYDASTDNTTFWYSGARYDSTGYVWSTVAERVRASELFTRIKGPMRAFARGPRREVPELTDPP